MFVKTVLQHHENLAIRSHATLFSRLVVAIELLVGNVRVVVPAGVFDRHAKAYVEEYVHRYGEDNTIPKMHYLTHFGVLLRRSERLLNC